MAHEHLDVPKAVRFVDEFIQILNRDHELYDVAMRNMRRHESPPIINQQIGTVEKIADAIDPRLGPRLRKVTFAWRYRETLNAAEELSGRLWNLENEQAIFGPSGPQMAASGMHPTVWGAAAELCIKRCLQRTRSGPINQGTATELLPRSGLVSVPIRPKVKKVPSDPPAPTRLVPQIPPYVTGPSPSLPAPSPSEVADDRPTSSWLFVAPIREGAHAERPPWRVLAPPDL